MILLLYFLQACLSTAAYLAIYVGWWRYLQARQESPAYCTSFHFLLAATFMWTQIYVVVLVLGLLRQLDRSLVLAVNAGITCFLLGSMRARKPHSPGMFSVLRARAREILWSKPRDPLFLAMAGICAIGVAWFAVLNIAFPPGGYDDFVFHLPTAAMYLQQHSIAMTRVAPVQDGMNSASKLGELFSVFQFSLTGDDRLVHFWSLAMVLQYLLAVYALCRELGATARNALFGSILSAFAPTLICQTLTSYNDLPVAALFGATLAFAINRSRGFWQRLATGASCGLLLSSKLSAFLLCAIALVCGILVDKCAKPDTKWTDALKPFLTIGTIALLLGGWWTMRNLAAYGNPFYPFEAKIGGIGFPGLISSREEIVILNRELARMPTPVRLWHLWREEKSHYGLWFYNYDSAYVGFGPLFFVLGLPSLAAASAISLLERRWIAAAVMLLTVGLYFGFSGNAAPRLSLFILPAVGVGISIVLTSMQRSWPWNRFTILPRVIKSAGVALAAFTFLAVGAAPIGPQTLHTQLYGAPRDKDSIDGTFLNAFAQVRKAIPYGAVVGYDEKTAFLWPLWRPDWGNQVRFVPTAGGWDRWRDDASRLRVTHVVLARPDPSPMKDWVEQHTDKFKLLAQGGFGALYEYRQ